MQLDMEKKGNIFRADIIAFNDEETNTPAPTESYYDDYDYYREPGRIDQECWDCHGTGRCSNCNGSVGEDNYGGAGVGWVRQNCHWCGGTGRCRECGGTGRI